MKFIVFEESSASLPKFVDFWEARYSYRLEGLYEKHIKDPFSCTAVRKLFMWKNGTPLSPLKTESVEANYVLRIDDARNLPRDTTPEQFLETFPKGGAIWRIFWLHCWNQDFPIYDQHVHRAMKCIQNENAEEIGQYSDNRKIHLYLTQYIPFYRNFCEIDGRKVDRALWAFGKFMKAWKHPDAIETVAE